MTAFWNKLKKDRDKKGRTIRPEERKQGKGRDNSNGKRKSASKEAEKAEVREKNRKNKGEKKGKKKERKLFFKQEKAELANRVLIKPVISENAMNQQTLGKYVFEISQTANKHQVAEAIEAKYGVSVKKVNILRQKAKARRFRWVSGKEKGRKKAIITIQQGESIELFAE